MYVPTPLSYAHTTPQLRTHRAPSAACVCLGPLWDPSTRRVLLHRSRVQAPECLQSDLLPSSVLLPSAAVAMRAARAAYCVLRPALSCSSIEHVSQSAIGADACMHAAYTVACAPQSWGDCHECAPSRCVAPCSSYYGRSRAAPLCCCTPLLLCPLLSRPRLCDSPPPLMPRFSRTHASEQTTCLRRPSTTFMATPPTLVAASAPLRLLLDLPLAKASLCLSTQVPFPSPVPHPPAPSLFIRFVIRFYARRSPRLWVSTRRSRSALPGLVLPGTG